MIRKNINLRYETVNPLLKETLIILMNESLFDPFTLVGGTNLSLRLGHRMSDDIDLFTEYEYDSLDYSSFERYLKDTFPYYECTDKSGITGFGKSFFIGRTKDDSIKLDLMYTDPFIEKPETIDGIRLATLPQMAAMKIEAINNEGGGRKKDWWDIHELLNDYSLEQMLDFHQTWQKWTHDREKILHALTNFTRANDQPDPRCLKGKDWDLIRLDIIDEVNNLK